MKSNSDCVVCGKKHRQKYRLDPAREAACGLCLDCHGQLEAIGPYVYRCVRCRAKHSSGFGLFTRSNVLSNSLYGVVTDYSEHCVISPNLVVARRVHPERK